MTSKLRLSETAKKRLQRHALIAFVTVSIPILFIHVTATYIFPHTADWLVVIVVLPAITFSWMIGQLFPLAEPFFFVALPPLVWGGMAAFVTAIIRLIVDDPSWDAPSQKTSNK